jgi:VanZ family protein
MHDTTLSLSATSTRLKQSRASRGALAIYVLVLIYASLNPFLGWQLPRAYTLLTWPKYITLFDVFINIIAYAPLGALLASLFRRRLMVLRPSHPRLFATVGALLMAALLSIALEFAQSFLPDRVSTPLDVVSNSIGGLLGAMLVMLPIGRVLIAAIVRWRGAHFAHRASTGWGLLLLAIWFVAQLNPAIPFFEAGLISPTDPTNIDPALNTAISAYDPLVLLPQAVGVALNVCAFALFVSLILHPKKSVSFNIGVVLIAGLLAKLTMAALLLKAPLIAASLSPATVIGLTSGLLFFLFFSRVGYRWRAFWATLFVFAGGVMTKLSSVYSALDETLKLFNWPYGQLANFTSLTRWLNEIWPLAALLFLATIFIRTKRN